MKPKENRRGKISKINNYDQCQTPYYALDPLLPFLSKKWIIWESACGEGQIIKKLYQEGFNIIGSDLLSGDSFFSFEPELWDCQVTNPPYSIKYDWLERSCQLGKPFALLMPVEVLGAAKGQRCIEDSNIEIILLNRRVNFKMPNIGYNGNGAQFPTAWYTKGLGIGQQLTFGKINYYKDGQLSLLTLTRS